MNGTSSAINSSKEVQGNGLNAMYLCTIGINVECLGYCINVVILSTPALLNPALQIQFYCSPPGGTPEGYSVFF